MGELCAVKKPKISEAVVRRLPVYLRILNHLSQMEIKTISSQELGEKLDLNPAQIRKDLAYFGEFGKKGIGYDVVYLIEKIRQILKLDNQINVALVGAGHLGHALSNYNMYLNDNIRIVALFDDHPTKIGQKIGGIVVQPIKELLETVKQCNIRIGIITVPATEAQGVANQFVRSGVEAILNFAPTVIKVPADIRVHYADFSAELLSLPYYLEKQKHQTN
jgi:redox-sensing transcriptional repressor